jgi:predicted HicB family RNase H-like nuclease
MRDTLSYRGYTAKIEFDAADRVFFGRLAGINDGVGFHADTVEDLIAAFREAVDDYTETCAKIGKPPQKPYSGKLMFRVDPEIHAQAALAAKLKGQSLNTWAANALRDAAQLTAGGAVAV